MDEEDRQAWVSMGYSRTFIGVGDDLLTQVAFNQVCEDNLIPAYLCAELHLSILL